MSDVTILLTIFLLLPNLNAQKVDPELRKLLETGKRVDVFVSFTGQVEKVLDRIKQRHISERGPRNSAIQEALANQAATDQSGVQQLLSLRSTDFSKFETFWISNEMLVTDANLAVVQEIAKDEKVKYVFLEPELEDDYDKDAGLKEGEELLARNWHHVKMQTEEGWQLLKGNKGRNVIVANVDSGVQGEHETLRDNFLGEHGWFDSWEGTKTPTDTRGHGTACMSLLAGGLGLGVAPDAKWVACRRHNKGDNGTTTVQMRFSKQCMQFMVCPDGTKNNCTKTPHVFSYSMSTTRIGSMDADFKVLQEAGIISVVAAGNIKNHEDRICGTIKYPASLENVIAVGSYFPNGQLRNSSAVGPTDDGRVKPDVVAPGHVWIAAIDSKSNSEYRISSGTSYAAPLVAGLVALLRVRDPDLTFENALKILQKSADPNVSVYEKHLCTDETRDKIPNNFFGYGIINVRKALEVQAQMLSKAEQN